MRLSKIAIRRFKGIDNLELFIPKTDLNRPGSADFLSLVGENNLCKSTVLEALRLALPGTDISTPSIDHFPKRDIESGPIELELEFDEITAPDAAEQGIRTHVQDGKYRVKKVWDKPGGKPEIFAFESNVDIPSWPENEKARANFEAAGDGWVELLATYDAKGDAFPQKTTKDSREKLRQHAIDMNSPVVVRGAAQWIPNPGGFSSHVDSILPKAIYVPAIKETAEETKTTAKTSAARQIVEAMFANQLAGHPAVMKFAEAGEEVKALFVSEEGNEIVRGVEKQITDKLKRLIDLEADLEFTPPDFKADLAGKTDLGIKDGDVRTKPEHQGHGAQRSLILSLLEVLAESSLAPAANGFQRGLLFLIEEPEIYLHPQMCRRMRDVLVAIARGGTAQVICTTHSPVFLDLADRHDGIAILRKADGLVSVLQRTEDLFDGDDDEDRKRLRMLLDFDASVNEVFFARNVRLVEGDSERAAVDAIGKKLVAAEQIDSEKFLSACRHLVVVNCRGKWTIRAFQRVLNGFNIPYKVIHDQDAEGAGGANAAILALLNDEENRRLVHTPNFEQQLFAEEWSTDKPWKTTKTIGEMAVPSAGLTVFFEFILGKTVAELA